MIVVRGVEPEVRCQVKLRTSIVFYVLSGDDPMCGIQAVSEKHEDVQILCQHFGPLHKGDKCWAFGTAFFLT